MVDCKVLISWLTWQSCTFNHYTISTNCLLSHFGLGTLLVLTLFTKLCSNSSTLISSPISLIFPSITIFHILFQFLLTSCHHGITCKSSTLIGLICWYIYSSNWILFISSLSSFNTHYSGTVACMIFSNSSKFCSLSNIFCNCSKIHPLSLLPFLIFLPFTMIFQMIFLLFLFLCRAKETDFWFLGFEKDIYAEIEY